MENPDAGAAKLTNPGAVTLRTGRRSYKAGKEFAGVIDIQYI